MLSKLPLFGCPGVFRGRNLTSLQDALKFAGDMFGPGLALLTGVSQTLGCFFWAASAMMQDLCVDRLQSASWIFISLEVCCCAARHPVLPQPLAEGAALQFSRLISRLLATGLCTPADVQGVEALMVPPDEARAPYLRMLRPTTEQADMSSGLAMLTCFSWTSPAVEFSVHVHALWRLSLAVSHGTHNPTARLAAALSCSATYPTAAAGLCVCQSGGAVLHVLHGVHDVLQHSRDSLVCTADAQLRRGIYQALLNAA